MTIQEAKNLRKTILESSTLLQPSYVIEKKLTDGERISNFHDWANGKLYEGAFLIRNDYGEAYWLVLIKWNLKIGYYLVVFPEKKSGPMIEIRNLENTSASKFFTWRYKPSKRDKNNEERKRIFEKYSLDLNVSISFPEKSYEVQAFLDELFSLAEIRIKADALIANEPEIREGFPEGKRIERLHYRRERNPKVVRLAKKNFKEKNGRLFCQICGFDFQQVYGKVGEDYIEAHHTLPLSEIENEQTQTQIEDIALLCSNCHKMIHRKRPWLTMIEIKNLIANHK
ncbi:MAG: HNH endonuclease [Saprospiraceae bacterium]|nr:HNH endonuclease [Saprospiraceae bacterium]